jgi:hypothetical protein
MIRIALEGLEPIEGELFEVVTEGWDYRFTTERHATSAPRRTFVLEAGDVLGALFDGAAETRATMSLLDGPLFLAGPPFPFPPLVEHARARGNAAMLEAYAVLHRQWMIEAAFPLMLAKAIEFLAAGELQIVKDVVWIDGVPGPCRMGDGPAICREQEKSGIPVSCPYVWDGGGLENPPLGKA